jgi:hypothetical protein
MRQDRDLRGAEQPVAATHGVARLSGARSDAKSYVLTSLANGYLLRVRRCAFYDSWRFG